MTERNEEIRAKESKVFDTYEHLATELLETGYRHNAIYLARKAVVDWELMMMAGIHRKRVLNVGCFEPIDELFFGAAAQEWVAIDLSPQSIQMARELIDQNAHPKIAQHFSFKVMDAQKLDFPADSFDTVVSFSVIDHIPDPDVRHRVICEMARVTKPGGNVVITVPNRYSYFHVMHRRNVRKKVHTHVGYQYFYSYWELKRELQVAGLAPLRFTSDMRNVGDLPKIARALIYPFVLFGDRMGFLAQKRKP